MELNQLQTFLAVADAGSLTGAAEKLYLTQPAISRQIQSLEASLGVALFDRVGRGVQLTDAGMVLKRYAEQCLGLVEDCRLAIAEMQKGTSGHLSLGVGGTHPMAELPGWLQAYAQRFPSVEVSVRTGRSHEMIAAVRERKIDLAFVRVPVTDPRLSSTALYEEPIILVAQPEQHSERSRLNRAQVLSNPLILFPSGTSFRAEIDAALGTADTPPKLRIESDSVDEIRRFVAMGMGMAFLPASTVKEEIAAGRLVEAQVEDMPNLTRPTNLVALRDRYQSAAMREFIQLVRA